MKPVLKLTSSSHFVLASESCGGGKEDAVRTSKIVAVGEYLVAAVFVWEEDSLPLFQHHIDAHHRAHNQLSQRMVRRHFIRNFENVVVR